MSNSNVVHFLWKKKMPEGLKLASSPNMKLHTMNRKVVTTDH
jgi:hypothetical protein